MDISRKCWRQSRSAEMHTLTKVRFYAKQASYGAEMMQRQSKAKWSMLSGQNYGIILKVLQ